MKTRNEVVEFLTNKGPEGAEAILSQCCSFKSYIWVIGRHEADDNFWNLIGIPQILGRPQFLTCESTSGRISCYQAVFGDKAGLSNPGRAHQSEVDGVWLWDAK